MALYYFIIVIPFFDELLFRYLSWNAWAASRILNLFGQHTLVSENVIQSAGYVVNVRRGCDALEPSWFLCAAILAFPAPFKRKTGGILLGISVIGAINVVRIASLFLIGLYSPRLFPAAHLEIWPVIFILLAVGLWIGWIARLRSMTAHA